MANVFTEHVAPAIGNVLAAVMLCSPFPAVMDVRRRGSLGDLNPLPYPFTVLNAVGWVVYGFAMANPYIFPANVLGFLAGLFFTFTAYECSPRKVRDQTMGLLILAGAHFITLGLIGCFALSPTANAKMWGTSCVVILMAYYFVPLSTMVTIIRTKSAASIYPPLAVTAVANGSMWTIYGLAIKDFNIWMPNLFGSVIAVIQLLLRLVYGKGKDAAPASSLPHHCHEDHDSSVNHHSPDGELSLAGRRASETNLLKDVQHGHSHGHGHHHGLAPDGTGGDMEGGGGSRLANGALKHAQMVP